MKLSFITDQMQQVVEVRGRTDPEVKGVACDSRRVKPGRIFVAIEGTREDGRKYIADAIERGAVAVVAEGLAHSGDSTVPIVQVKNAAAALGRIADILYAKPSFSMKVVGTTGTNGKSTVTYLTRHLMERALGRAGMIGTICYDDGMKRRDASQTTPQAHEIHALLAAMAENGCKGAAMEVSSHGLDQQRVSAVRFDVGIFTNLTRDHLDYHGSMEAYFRAKCKLPLMMAEQRAAGGKDGVMVINTDDIHGQVMARDFKSRLRVLTYGFGAGADMRAVRVKMDARGTHFALAVKGREIMVRIPLIGRFNVGNALAALAAAASLDLNLREAVRNLEDCPQIPGRLQSVVDRGPFRVFVDYAHTPDALENVLNTLKELKPARILTVVGCGGDRDREKRPMMARIAADLSDAVVLTSDNPRGEEPSAILKQMEVGITGRNYKIVEDRREAIQVAIDAAGDRDIVLVAGKGHEPYQEIKGERLPFDDADVVREAVKFRKGGGA